MSDAPAAPPAPGPVLTISPDPAVVTVIERFDVAPDRQAEAVEWARRHIGEAWTGDPAFIGALLLRSRNVHGGDAVSRAPGGLACYAQWRRPADGDAPDAPPAPQSLAAALPTFRLLDSRTYSVEFTAQAPSVAAPTLVSAERAPGAHFGLFPVTPERQNRMVDRARGHAPTSLVTPGLLTINFHRSLDGRRVVNLGTWADFAGFQALVRQPGFRDDDLYWQGVADFEPAFFDVVAVFARR